MYDRYSGSDLEHPGIIKGALIDQLEDDLLYMGQRRWRPEDHYGLSFVVLLDLSIESGRFTERIPEPRRSALMGEVATFHAALPFAENERRMIVDEYDELVFPTGLRDAVRQRIPRQKICVEGIARTTSGRELMERWWSWRRGRDAYQGGEGLAVARSAVLAAYDLGRATP